MAATVPDGLTRAEQVRRYLRHAVDRLAAAQQEIDHLNVYPVPDGDTGTNLLLTVRAACDALPEPPRSLEDDLRALARGALLGARGNSGVILSQLIGATARTVAGTRLDSHTLAGALRAASDAAYAAVEEPVEGTMLTVARAAAEAAESASGSLGDRLSYVAEAAAVALAGTPEQLPELARAGVVDAGGRGLCVLYDAAAEVAGGHAATPAPTRTPAPTQQPGQERCAVGDLAAGGPAYEVMYLLDADDGAVGLLRQTLRGLGDSLVVVGGDGLWHVHVHVDDVGAAVEAGIEAGRPRRIRVTHFVEQAAVRSGKRAVVAVAAGEGLAGILRDAGAEVIRTEPGRRASVGEILTAIRATGGSEVIVLPNDSATVAASEAAAREAAADGVHVVVVPTQAQVQCLAAMAVHDRDRGLEDDVVSMTAAARGTRHGAVTVAAKRAITTAGACEQGDALGVVQGDFAVVGAELYAVALDVLGRLLGGGGELVTIVAGEDGAELARRCEEWVLRHHTGVEVVVYDGGQRRYPLLLSVE